MTGDALRPWTEQAALGMFPALIEAARRGSADIGRLLTAILDDGLNAPPMLLARFGPVAVWGQEFLFLLEADQSAAVAIDGGPPLPMARIEGTRFWYRLETLRLGTTHNLMPIVDGQSQGGFGGSMPRSVAGYNPESYPLPGAPHGTLSDKRTVTSRIYGGATADYWIYTNPGIDTARGAPVTVWLDGRSHVGSFGLLGVRLQTVTDNLVHRGLIPPMVHVLLQPGTGGSRVPSRLLAGQTPEHALRSVQFDTVSDEFGRHVLTEVLPDVEAVVKLRQDGYSRAIAGESSGGIAAFKTCWFAPDQFSRAISTIASYTALQWHPDQHLDGGYIFPFLVRREPRRNIRVWLSDGIEDIDVESSVDLMGVYEAGSWPLSNIQMAQSLKTRLYDFHFRYGTASHNSAQYALDLPETLRWLWRGYDPSTTFETYEQEASERAKPLYRVQIANRDAW
ncbi:MAG: esterase [Chloroflexi bacterium]|nr:esterase [Chloroflexota bacterium]